MTNLAIIPARGGSKRIPRKNIKNFLGKPIIAYSIDVALKSRLFDEVMVSTDDTEIAKIAKEYGAQVPFIRSKNNSDDNATTIDVIFEVLNNYKKQEKIFHYACCIYPAAPFIKAEHLLAGYKNLVTNNLSSVIPIVAFSYPIWRSYKINDQGKIQMNWSEYQKSRSQDLPIAYHDAGQWYWFRTDRIHNAILTNNTGCIILPEYEVQDIDTITDWELAEMKYKFSLKVG